MDKPKFKIKNLWRIAFFILLGLLTAALIFVFIKITRVPGTEEYIAAATVEEDKEEPSFLVQLTKKQLNQLIQSYLKEYQNNSEMKYEFLLEDEAVLKGTFNILGFEVGYYLYFEPSVLENGKVLLKAKSISLGTLSLPVSKVMELVADNIETPSWIGIDSGEEAIILHLDQFVLKNGMHFKARKIDLPGDSIQIDVYLPDTF